jgi:NADH dehydrogenase
VNLAKEVGVDPSFVTIDIVESNGRLLPTLPEKVSRLAEMRLRKLGINILTNRALQSQDIAEIALKDMDMKAGTVVWTAGTRISTSYDGLPLSERKRVVVTPMLTLPGDNHVFIAGDGAATQYSGLAQTAIHNGEYIADAILRMIHDKSVKPYVPHRPSFVVPIGSNWAILNSGTFVMTGFIPWILRNMIDFRYFTSIVPLSHVFEVFRKGYKYRKSHGGCEMQKIKALSRALLLFTNLFQC